MINVVISGIVTGALYAIAGLGLVAVYRTSRVLNFALGGMGAVATYVAYDLLGHGVAYAFVIPIAIVVGGLLGLIVEVGVARPLRRLSPITVALGTLGALLIFQGAVGAHYGYTAKPLREALAGAGTFRAGSFAISANQILILGVTIVVTLILGLVISRTRLGLAMRAVSSGPQTSELLGVNVSRTRLAAWVIGGAYGALAAMLVTPLTFLSPTSFTTFLLTAFAAVVLGGFTSLRGVVIGAIAFGVVINVAEAYLPSGLSATYTFIGIALVLVLRPNGLFGLREHEVSEPDVSGRGQQLNLGGPRESEATRALAGDAGRRWALSGVAGKASGWLVVLIVLIILPFVLSGPSVYLMATALASFIAVLGLNIVTGYAGQVSLGHAGFLAIGAYAAATASAHAGMSTFATLAVALVVGGIAGIVIGLPATRLSGIYLVVLTLVFSFAVPELVKRLGDFTGGTAGLPLPAPSVLSDATSQYWFVLAVAGVVATVAIAASATRLGRGWRAVRDSETGARALGLNPTFIKLGAFALSSALAALSGAITGMLVGFVGPESYGVFQSIYILLAVVLGGSGSVFGSLLGAVFITLVPHYTSNSSVPPDLIFGVVLIAILAIAPSGLTGLLESLVARARSHRRLRGTADEQSTSVAAPGDRPTVRSTLDAAGADSGSPDVLLELRGVSAGYGLVTVLRDVSLEVRRGEIVALIGANGAGKSTLLRTVSQVVPHSAGQVLWRGREIGGPRARAPHEVARLGISHVPEGRAIFPDLTVAENLTMGTFGVGGREEANGGRVLDREEVLVHFPRLRERLKQRAGTLSGGEQQMLAIARALLGRPELLMLDEPSLGLAPVITQQVFEIVREIAASGVPVLLVEQNANAALALADRGYVLTGGEIALSGGAESLREDERIAQTYLAKGTA
jgi:ABC-type branched-subunit amino acid transport system permease subunit/ABC-type branched-subunit amino acid transport system ATPase component